MLDRTIEPAFQQITDIHFIEAKKHLLSNQIPVFEVNAGEQDLVRIEFIFQNVAWEKSKPLLPSVCNSMLTEGTHSLSAAQIASKIDFYGAFFQTEYSFDQSSLTLFSLNKHVAHTLPIIKEMLTASIFPEKELNTFLRNQQQKLKVGLEKNSVLARRSFNRALFGDSLYGYPYELKDYDEVKRADLLAYYQEMYHPKNCTIIVSGKIQEETIAHLEQLFGSWSTEVTLKEFNINIQPDEQKWHDIEKPQALQSAIRLGISTVNRTHPDFMGLQVLNTVLGGYFGSRLMANIREDKGYTYGIGSANVTLQHAGFFFIASEVGADVCGATLTEIEKEIAILKTELIPNEELALVRNYLMGSLLGSLENAFSHADKFKNLYFYGLGYDYYDQYIQTIQNINAEELRALANKYWNFEDFYKVIVGKM
ncbi:MAG: insulinase family protein [Sphingobacteriales bacterium]|nr:insulinase family protein [Sphingobacteriales bacterium]